MVIDLRRTGMTQAEIAAAIGSGQTYISGIERGDRGKRIGFLVGQKLHALWLSKCSPDLAPSSPAHESESV